MEALSSPNLVQSFQTGDVGELISPLLSPLTLNIPLLCHPESSKKFVEMFTVMERLPQLTQYYRTVQKKILQQYWTECVDSSHNSGSAAGCLRIFYDHLYENWQKESRWCLSVFGQGGYHESALVIIETLVSLQPGRDMVITSSVKQSNDKLAILGEASAANIYFGGLVKRCIASSQFVFPEQTVKSMIFVIYDFFDSFITQYTSAEQNHLLGQLEEFQLIHSTCADSVRALGSTNSKIFLLCTSALNRCEEITQSCGLVSLVTSLNVSTLQWLLFSCLIDCHSIIFSLNNSSTSSKYFLINTRKPNSNSMRVETLNRIGAYCKRAFLCCKISETLLCN